MLARFQKKKCTSKLREWIPVFQWWVRRRVAEVEISGFPSHDGRCRCPLDILGQIELGAFSLWAIILPVQRPAMARAVWACARKNGYLASEKTECLLLSCTLLYMPPSLCRMEANDRASSGRRDPPWLFSRQPRRWDRILAISWPAIIIRLKSDWI